MNLSEKTKDNLTFMINEMLDKLQAVNRGVIKAEDYDIEDYEDVYDLYSMVVKKKNFSVSEIEAIVSELGNLRK